MWSYGNEFFWHVLVKYKFLFYFTYFYFFFFRLFLLVCHFKVEVAVADKKEVVSFEFENQDMQAADLLLLVVEESGFI